MIPGIDFDTDTANGIFTGTATTSSISTTNKTITWHVSDNHYPYNDKTEVEQKLVVSANTAPVNVSDIADQEFNAGESIVFTFADNLFSDEDGESVVNYTFSSSPTASWLSLNATNRTFTGVPHVNDDAMLYTITLYAHDPNVNSAHGNIVFDMNIIENEIPELDQGLHTAVVNVSVHHEFTYVIPTDAYKDNEGEVMTITMTLAPAEFAIVYDDATRTISGTLADNTKYGDYQITIQVEDIWQVDKFNDTLDFTYNENMPPSNSTAMVDPTCSTAHYAYSYSLPKSNFADPDGDSITFYPSTNESSPFIDWMTISQNTTHINFDGTPTNSQYGNQTISILLDDGNTDIANTTATFVLCIDENREPQLTGTVTAVGDGTTGFPWSYEFEKAWIVEEEGEALTYSCSITPAKAWVS